MANELVLPFVSSSSLCRRDLSHCVSLYFRFSLCLRDIEEMIAKCGITVSYETVCKWCLKFDGPTQSGFALAARVLASGDIGIKSFPGLDCRPAVGFVALRTGGREEARWR